MPLPFPLPYHLLLVVYCLWTLLLIIVIAVKWWICDSDPSFGWYLYYSWIEKWYPFITYKLCFVVFYKTSFYFPFCKITQKFLQNLLIDLSHYQIMLLWKVYTAVVGMFQNVCSLVEEYMRKMWYIYNISLFTHSNSEPCLLQINGGTRGWSIEWRSHTEDKCHTFSLKYRCQSEWWSMIPRSMITLKESRE